MNDRSYEYCSGFASGENRRKPTSHSRRLDLPAGGCESSVEVALERLTWSATRKLVSRVCRIRESLGLPTKTLNWRESSIRHSRSARWHKLTAAANGRSIGDWSAGQDPRLATCGAARVIGSGWERGGEFGLPAASRVADSDSVRLGLLGFQS